MTKVRWIIKIGGPTHGMRDGVNPGDVMELDDATAERYLRCGYVTRHLHGELPKPFQLGTLLPPSARDDRFAQNRKAR